METISGRTDFRSLRDFGSLVFHSLTAQTEKSIQQNEKAPGRAQRSSAGLSVASGRKPALSDSASSRTVLTERLPKSSRLGKSWNHEANVVQLRVLAAPASSCGWCTVKV